MVNPIPPNRPHSVLQVKPRRGAARAATAVVSLRLPLLVLLGSFLVLLALGPAPAAAQSSTVYFLTAKRGITDASKSGEELFKALEGVHGELLNDRAVDPNSLELTIYGVSGGAGLGLGMEVLRYVKDWNFADGEKVHMEAKGVLFTLSAFLRLGPLFPFVGGGFGNYYVNYDQPTGLISLRDSPSSALTARVGTRLLLGRLGFLIEAGNTRAQLEIPSSAGRATLELGGNYANAGVSWVF